MQKVAQDGYTNMVKGIRGDVDRAPVVSHTLSILSQNPLLFTLSLFSPATVSSSLLQFLGGSKREGLFE